jgi:hypothetical protein
MRDERTPSLLKRGKIQFSRDQKKKKKKCEKKNYHKKEREGKLKKH